MFANDINGSHSHASAAISVTLCHTASQLQSWCESNKEFMQESDIGRSISEGMGELTAALDEGVESFRRVAGNIVRNHTLSNRR